MTEAKKPEGAAVDKDALLADQQLRQSYGAKVCPIISIGVDKFADDPGLLTNLGERPAGQKDAEVAACVGPACQFFMLTSADKVGRPTGGGCAVALLPAAVMRLQETIAAGIAAMIPKSDPNKS